MEQTTHPVNGGTDVTDYGAGATVGRSDSIRLSQAQTIALPRGGTLKKKNSIKRSGSIGRVGALSRSASQKSLHKESGVDNQGDDIYSAFFTPIPTKGSPTEILADRFQEWRKVLKDLLVYFKEVQKSHEAKAKSLNGLSDVISRTSISPALISEGGITDATSILRQYHKQAAAETSKAKSVEDDIIVQLTGLRSDLAQKIKEIRNLSGDFKNAVDKECENTKKAVRNLQESLAIEAKNPEAASGKNDPFLIRMAVDRQVERQIDEENYLHQAFLNLENSGRELESIVIGEIQKAYNAYAGILKREADEMLELVESLRTGPVAMPKDREWEAFLDGNEHFVNPRMPVRKPEQIHYPGRDATAAAEIRAGMLERKSKYLKSYTPGWYVLSPTHLHEFKSADRISSQSPVMSLSLLEQKLGNHSGLDSSSHKFMLKGRQSGGIGMHRGHGWVFRAESHDTMLTWYEDVRALTEKSGEERNAFVRSHARSLSSTSAGGARPRSVSSDGIDDDDEADQVPYSGAPSQRGVNEEDASRVTRHEGRRPVPGGRFPSDLDVARHLHAPVGGISRASSSDIETNADGNAIATAPARVSTAAKALNERESPSMGKEESMVNQPSLAGHHEHIQSIVERQQAQQPSALPTQASPNPDDVPAIAAAPTFETRQSEAVAMTAPGELKTTPVGEAGHSGAWTAPLADRNH